MDFGASFSEYVPKAQHSTPTTNAAPHVDGGPGGASGTNLAANSDDMAALHVGAAIIAVALLLLWMMGGVIFKSARL